MTANLKFALLRLTANYWFYPALFSLGAAGLALAMIAADRSGAAAFLYGLDGFTPAQPKGAADMLTVMAGSMIGVAATVFSITIAAVAYASGNYGPRLLTNFMEDRGNQLSLATFIASFVYALIVLRAVRAEGEVPAGAAEAAAALPGFTPQLSLLVAYILMAVCVAVLVYFLNHIPSSIRISTVLEDIGERLIRDLRETYPVEDALQDAREPVAGTQVRSQATGYVQFIDFTGLETAAKEHGAVISLMIRTGDFVHRDLPLLQIAGADPEGFAGDLRAAFTFGANRTASQDPQFLIDQLVEIGLRALSPGINDPFTAITALHWLGAATAEVGRRDLRKDVCGKGVEDCCVIPRADDFSHYVERGFGSIRSAVAASPNAARIMLEAIENAAAPIPHAKRRQILRQEGDALMEQARLTLSGPDLERLETRYREFTDTFDAKPVRAA
ncbi:DUF2254 domain-containing protein [Erythrobacter sp. EC-HK427]|uniref:DUF2254 domain-containing protein n=1 Tax=Erythrobacter sp. EC-HK427 TaxID=2038396 RepID=UPI00125817D8|nr:DUF2254 domain-containing protein [Erythrobacter sp. EC-HK427]VVS98765.1 conserved membrane hypothetical protein [Erythrobacter sp. EC-HK427]